MNGTPLAMFDVMPMRLNSCTEERGISLESFHATPLGIAPSLAADDARSHAPFSAEVFA